MYEQKTILLLRPEKDDFGYIPYHFLRFCFVVSASTASSLARVVARNVRDNCTLFSLFTRMGEQRH